MNVLEGIKSFFLNGRGRTKDGEDVNLIEAFGRLSAKLSYKKLAIDACVNLIASTIAGCEFRTYQDGVEVKRGMHHMFNVRPNQRQSGFIFWKRVVSRLLKENEVLIISHDGKLYIADTFMLEPVPLGEDRYTGVQVGEHVFVRPFYSGDVVHIKLNDTNIKNVIDSMYADYGILLDSAAKVYKSDNVLRVLVEEPANRNMMNQEDVEKFYNEALRTWFNADGAGVAVPLPKDFKLHDWSSSDRLKRDTRDVKALIDDVIDFVALGFRVPARLLRGDIAELNQAMTALIAFVINPLAKLIGDELNAKLYSQYQYFNRTYVKIDTRRITLTDLNRLAVAVDKFTASSVHSTNDNRQLMGEEPIDQPWAYQYLRTKNHESADMQKGGEESGEVQTTENT